MDLGIASLIGAGITAAAGTTATVASGVQTGKLNKKNRDWQDEVMARQRSQYLQDVADERRYNTMSAQVARAKKAGLNPAFLTGGEAVTANSPQSQNSVSPATLQTDFSQLTPALNALPAGLIRYSELELAEERQQIERDLVSQQILESQQKIIESASRTKGIEADTFRKSVENEFVREREQKSLDKIQSEIDVNIARNANLTEQSMKLAYERKYLLPAQLDEIKAGTQLYYQKVQETVSQIQLNEQLAIESSDRSLKMSYENDSIRLSNELREATKEYEIQMAEYKVKYAKQENARKWMESITDSAVEVSDAALSWLTFGQNKRRNNQPIYQGYQPTSTR